MGVSFEKGGFIIEPTAGEQEVRKLLKDYEPWRHKIDFTNGISTTDFKTFAPFNPAPTSKIQAVEHELGPLSGYKRALDVGCNAGYHSIYLAARYGTEVVGFDYSERHVKVSTEMARLAGVKNCRFQAGDAETFKDPTGFDLIIHFGTLYHLKNPVLAVETALGNLRRGGMMLIETQLYGGPDETRAAFIYGLGGDKSNWWALGEAALIKICEVLGAEASIIGKRYKLPIPDQHRAFFKVVKLR